MKRKKRDVFMQPHAPSRQWTWLKSHPWIQYPLLSLAVAAVISMVVILILSQDLPSLSELEKAGDPFLVTRIISSDGQVLSELYKQRRVKVPYEQMPKHLINAVIASEDRRFWNHWGLDLKRIFYLGLRNILTMKIHGGASTITQQLARKLYLHPRKTVIRKLREQLSAIQIERTYSKTEIVEMYLNQMPLGRGAHGVQSAAMAYFDKNVEELTVEESALLVGLLQLPYGYYNPDNDTLAATKRRNVVLQSMVACQFLTDAEYDSIHFLPLGVKERKQKSHIIAPYFCEHVRREMQKKYGMSLYTGGLSIYTTLDTRIQACADSAVKAFIPLLEDKIRKNILDKKQFADWFDPPLETPEDFLEFFSDTALVDSVIEKKATLQVALVAVNSTNGQVLAMVGGRDFEKSKWNRAIQMARQPGSAFKPFVYTVAIDNGYPTTYELLNQPVVLIMRDGSRWSPKNYDRSTGGPTTFREGLKRSLNLVAARVIQEVVPAEKVVRYAKRFGFTTNIHPYDAIALGADVVYPIELTSAFSVFANHGVLVEPNFILRVEDKDGNVLEESVPKRKEVISEATAYIMTDMLRSVLDESHGTGTAARYRYHFYRPAAGKTGTTNDYRNAWFVGFTPQVTAGVWVGFDDERVTLGDGQTGAATALPIWAPFMRMVHDTIQYPIEKFVMPSGVVELKVCSETKKIATESCPEIWEEVFLKNMAPIDTCDVHGSPVQRKNRKKRVVF
jgi:penicillin-binding protein 1A